MTDLTRPLSLATHESYGKIRFSGAAKLADSNVAPLVAQARGYRTIDDQDSAREFADKESSPAKQQSNRTTVRRVIEGGGDLLTIPWHSIADVAKSGLQAQPKSMQFRPSTPISDPATGKERKYSSLAGNPSVLDVHPATPPLWLETARSFLITEGLLKADSALSAQLVAAGVTPEELAWVPSATTAQARTQLAQLMERIPPRERVVIVALIGVGNWHKNPEWNSVAFDGRKVLVAFDGDLRTNQQVWRQTEQIFEFIGRKRGTPLLLDLGSDEAEFAAMTSGYFTRNSDEKQPKIGIDDYLSKISGWEDLLTLTRADLPPAPMRAEQPVQEGDFRVAEEGTHTQKYVKSGDGSGYWVPAIDIGGRIKRAANRAFPANASMSSSIMNDRTTDLNVDGDEAVIELCWQDPVTDEVITRDVSGPAEIQSMLPTDWKGEKVRVHLDIHSHPSWPPRGKDAEKWLNAIKLHRRDQISSAQRWSTMGWVPAGTEEDDSPAYIINSGTLARTEEREQMHISGVDSSMISRASSFGVNDRYRDFTDIDDYREHVRDAISTAVNAFLIEGPWRNSHPVNGAIMLATALRPTIPGRPETVLYIHGEPHSGKSWAASFLLAFWQSEPNQWNEKQLTGTAQDTPTSTERFIARTPIWVSDDLAPASSRSEAERQETGIDKLIRMAFNGTGKGRATATGGVQKTLSPRALLVLTAENERTGKSITERVVQMQLSVGDTDDQAGQRIRDLSNDPSQKLSALTAAMIRFWVNEPGDQLTEEMLEVIAPRIREQARALDLGDWDGKRRLASLILENATAEIKDDLSHRYGTPPSQSARPAALYGELAATFDILALLGAWAGISLNDPVMRAIAREHDGSPACLLTERGFIDIEKSSKTTNAKQLVKAVKAMFEGGQAHLANATESGKPPFGGDVPGSDAMNVAVGWVRNPRNDDTWEPRGVEIGVAGLPPLEPEHGGEWVALLNSTNAFKAAQRHHPELIPYGQTGTATWQQVWSSENGSLVHSGVTREEGKYQGRVKFRDGGRVRGVPLKLSLFLDD